LASVRSAPEKLAPAQVAANGRWHPAQVGAREVGAREIAPLELRAARLQPGQSLLVPARNASAFWAVAHRFQPVTAADVQAMVDRPPGVCRCLLGRLRAGNRNGKLRDQIMR